MVQANKHFGKNLPGLLAMNMTSQMLINMKNYPSQPRISFASIIMDPSATLPVIHNCLIMWTARSNIFLAENQMKNIFL